MDKNEPKIAKNTYFSKLAAKYMDRIKFSTIDSTKLFSKIKQLVVILLLTTARDSHSAAVETTTGPSSAASPPQKSQSTIKPALALVSGCLLTALFITCLLFFYFRRYPEQQLELDAATGWAGGDRSFLKPAAAHGLDPAVIAAFTTFTYSAVKEIKIDQQVLECAVCLNEFYDHETLRLLPCCHVFHRECIDEWLDLHVTCPVCRANLVPTPGQLSSTTESCFDLNESTEDHVTVDVVDLKHDGSIRKSSRSYSMGHSMGRRRCIENVEKYTLILPDELQSALKNSADDVGEISMKKCVRSASATYVRESSYLGYESFVQEKLRLEDKV